MDVNPVPPVFSVNDLDLYYGKSRALNQINMEIDACKVTALIGPSCCGKSTFLRCLNWMNDTIPGTSVVGKIYLYGQDIFAPEVNLVSLRQTVGMVFQKPNPFPQSIFDNVAFGPRVVGLPLSKGTLLSHRENGVIRLSTVFRETCIPLNLERFKHLSRL